MVYQFSPAQEVNGVRASNYALPLYVQIAEALIRDIASGRYLDGERLPPERSLAETLRTTVTTLRKSLVLIEEKGLITRVQGSGNYVNAKADVDSVYALFRVELIEGGGLPTADILSVDRLEKTPDLPGFGTSEEGVRIRRLRSLNGTPCVLEEIWLDGSYASALSKDDLPDSLYHYYQRALDLWISHAEDRLSIAAVPDWTPPRFVPQAGDACLFAERISWARDGVSAEISRNWIDTNIARYVARIK